MDSPIDDDARAFQLKEIVDMLVAAGYFRARIKGLSAFDKVAGGMVWAISNSHTAVDTNILFEENASIGQRIKTGESIVNALHGMKCPYRVEPHQIHKSIDYPVLSRVIQWLIKSVMEHRLATGDFVRRFSELQFQKYFDKFPEESQSSKEHEAVESDRYDSSRKFRKHPGSTFHSMVEHVDATLLEYGDEVLRADSIYASNRDSRISMSGPGRNESSTDDAETRAKKQQERLDELKEGLVKKKSLRVSNVELIEDIQREEELYAERRKADEAASESKALENKEFVHRRNIDILTKKASELESKRRELSKKEDDLAESIHKTSKDLGEKNLEIERLLEESSQLRSEEQQTTNVKRIRKLNELVIRNEALRATEGLFKRDCKEQHSAMLKTLENLKKSEKSEESKRFKQIEELYESDVAKRAKARQLLARTNQEIAKIVRKIDEVPTRAELLQYERRIVELYELIAEKFKETKNYYALYNTLDEKYRFMMNEVSLMNSIQGNFTMSMKDTKSRAAFMQSVQKIVHGVENSVAKTQKTYESVHRELESANSKFQSFVEKQRAYYKAVKDFQAECAKNVQILEKNRRTEKVLTLSIKLTKVVYNVKAGDITDIFIEKSLQESAFPILRK
eukprot:627338_1